MKRKYFKIGEIFQFGLIKLKAVESNGYCTGCFLEDKFDRICEKYKIKFPKID